MIYLLHFAFFQFVHGSRATLQDLCYGRHCWCFWPDYRQNSTSSFQNGVFSKTSWLSLSLHTFKWQSRRSIVRIDLIHTQPSHCLVKPFLIVKKALVSKFSIFIWIRTTLWKDIRRNNIQFNFGNEKTSAMTRNWANLHFHIVFPRHCYQDLLLFDVIYTLPYRFYNLLLTRCGL